MKDQRRVEKWNRISFTSESFWSLESDSAERPATRMPSDILSFVCLEPGCSNREQEHKPGVWAVQPTRWPARRLVPTSVSLLTVPSNKTLGLCSKAPSSFLWAHGAPCRCLHSSEIAISMVEGVSPWSAGSAGPGRADPSRVPSTGCDSQ